MTACEFNQCSIWGKCKACVYGDIANRRTVCYRTLKSVAQKGPHGACFDCDFRKDRECTNPRKKQKKEKQP